MGFPYAPLPLTTMNKAEEAYAFGLEARKRRGEIRQYEFEGIKLRIGKGAYYTPDFLVIMADGEVQIHEVKGHWREAAKVRVKAILDRYPFRVYVNGKEWQG